MSIIAFNSDDMGLIVSDEFLGFQLHYIFSTSSSSNWKRKMKNILKIQWKIFTKKLLSDRKIMFYLPYSL